MNDMLACAILCIYQTVSFNFGSSQDILPNTPRML
jgi:hypothetical protein